MSESNVNNDSGFETRSIHAGQEYERWSNREMVTPIVTTNTFYQPNPTEMKVSFIDFQRWKISIRRSDFNDLFCSRDIITVEWAIQLVISLESCLASLEQSKHGFVYPSGSAATTALLHLLETGDHILSSKVGFSPSFLS